jgi:hypothetical protein
MVAMLAFLLVHPNLLLAAIWTCLLAMAAKAVVMFRFVLVIRWLQCPQQALRDLCLLLRVLA